MEKELLKALADVASDLAGEYWSEFDESYYQDVDFRPLYQAAELLKRGKLPVPQILSDVLRIHSDAQTSRG